MLHLWRSVILLIVWQSFWKLKQIQNQRLLAIFCLLVDVWGDKCQCHLQHSDLQCLFGTNSYEPMKENGYQTSLTPGKDSSLLYLM